MSDEERPGAPDAQESAPSGKLIEEEVFRSRLAARQDALADLAGQAEALSTLEEALKSLGILPDRLSPSSIAEMRPAALAAPESGGDARPSVEDLAVEELFLNELEAGRRPRLEDYLQRYPLQRDALLRLATQLDPRELAGLTAAEAMTPEARVAADLGQREGEMIVLRALATGAARPRRRRRRTIAEVAEERAPYDPSAAEGAPGASGAPDTPRARPVRPEDLGPET